MDRSHIKERRRGSTKSRPTVEPSRKQKRGRPKTSWRRSVTKEVGRTWNELRFLAADIQMWKELIGNLCSSRNNGLIIIIIIIIIII